MKCRAWAFAIAATLLGACQKTPSSLLVSLVNGQGMPQPDNVRLQVFDTTGEAYEQRSLWLSAAQPDLGTVVIFPAHKGASPLRVHAIGYQGQQPVSEGVAVAALEAGKQGTVQLTLSGWLADRDGDGVPDLIDICPDKPNPLQNNSNNDGRGDGCSPDPAGSAPDAAVDAFQAPTVDALEAGDASPDVIVEEDAGLVEPAPRQPNGGTCSRGGECESGFCVDGLCCESDCTTLCRSCALPDSLGRCALVPAGQDPRDVCHEQSVATCGMDGTCDGQGGCRLQAAASLCAEPRCATADTLSLASTCDGNGICNPGAGQSCSPFACAAGQCKTTCTTDADCAAGFSCVRGSCGRRPLGASCGGPQECDSANCVDGVCCSAPSCAGPCMACNVPGSAGSCHPIAAGGSPVAGGCTADLVDTCAHNGKCDGKGQCQLYSAGTHCGVGTCSAGIEVPAPVCDGLGHCLALPSVTCSPYVCGDNQCAGACRTSADCASSDYYCSSRNRCLRRLDAGTVAGEGTGVSTSNIGSSGGKGKN